MIDAAILSLMLKGGNYPEGLCYNSFGVAVVFAQWRITDGNRKVYFRLVQHDGRWYATSQVLCPVWGYGMPISDFSPSFPTFTEAMEHAHKILKNHFMGSRESKDVAFFMNVVEKEYQKWLLEPTLDVFEINDGSQSFKISTR